MSEAFLKVVNMSLSASWLVLAVLILRVILKKSTQMDQCTAVGIGSCSAYLPNFHREPSKRDSGCPNKNAGHYCGF